MESDISSYLPLKKQKSVEPRCFQFPRRFDTPFSSGGNRKRTLWLTELRLYIEAYPTKNNFERWLQPYDLSPRNYGCFHEMKRAVVQV